MLDTRLQKYLRSKVNHVYFNVKLTFKCKGKLVQIFKKKESVLQSLYSCNHVKEHKNDDFTYMLNSDTRKKKLISTKIKVIYIIIRKITLINKK